MSVVETLKCSLGVTHGHWKLHHLIDYVRLTMSLPLCSYRVTKAPPATARAPLRIGSVYLFVCLSIRLSVYLSPKCVHKNAIFSTTEQFRAVVSIDDLGSPTLAY